MISSGHDDGMFISVRSMSEEMMIGSRALMMFKINEKLGNCERSSRLIAELLQRDADLLEKKVLEFQTGIAEWSGRNPIKLHHEAWCKTIVEVRNELGHPRHRLIDQFEIDFEARYLGFGFNE